MQKQLDPELQQKCMMVAMSCASGNLRRATRAINQMYAASMKPSGLEPTQFMLLLACAVVGTAPITILAEQLVMDRTTLARNLKPLEKRGLLQISEGDDRRIHFVALTQAGEAALTATLPLWEEAQARVVEALGQQRLDGLLQDLTAVVELARKR